MPQVDPKTRKDSLNAGSTDSVPVPQKNYPHIFSGHALKPVHEGELKRDEATPVWPAVVLFVPVALLVYLYVTYHRKLNSLFKAFFSLQAARQLEREDYRLTRRTSVILSFVFLTALSFFLYQYNRIYGVVHMKWEPVIQFHVIFAGLIVLYALKLTFNSIMGFILDARSEMHEYSFNIFLSSQAAGLFLLPLAFCIQYLRYPVFPFLVAGFSVFILFYVIRLAKGVLIGLGTRNFSAFHLFLYLCALEILPLIVLITFLVRLNSWLGV